MSCYNWESGTITLPAKEWAGFRKGLLEAWNKRQLELLERAKRVHATLKAVCKGKRGKNRDAALKAAIGRHIDHNDEDLTELVLTYDRDKRAYALNGSQPQRKALKLFAVSKDAEVRLPDADVHFQNKGRTVTWDVPENNRAVEHANNHWFAQLLFEKLGRIAWSRGTGGKIIGNDEYSRDAGREYEGGGGSYVTREYRALTAKEKREAEQRRREQARYNYGYGGRARHY